MLFRDRQDAGQQLAASLLGHRSEGVLVLALPRGGVVVAHEIAHSLGAPLEVFVVRKLGAPGQPELGVGAIAEGGEVLVDAASIRSLHVKDAELAAIAAEESVELARRAALYRQGRPLPSIAGRAVILVDDGVATGVTARAAIRALRPLAPRKLILAAQVMAAASAEELHGEVDELVCLRAPESFGAVGAWYEQFPQTTDAEVLGLLGRQKFARHEGRPP